MNFQCRDCRIAFDSRSSMQDHKRTVHPPHPFFAAGIGTTVRRVTGGPDVGVVIGALMSTNQLLVSTPKGMVVAFDYADVEEAAS